MINWLHHTSPARQDQLLLDYTEGKLDAKATLQIEKHLARCPDCRRLVEDNQAYLEMSGQLVLKAKPVAVSGDLAEQIRQRLAGDSQTAQPVQTRQTKSVQSIQAVSEAPFQIIQKAPTPAHRSSGRSSMAWIGKSGQRYVAAAALVVLLAVGGVLSLSGRLPGQHASNAALDIASPQADLTAERAMLAEAPEPAAETPAPMLKSQPMESDREQINETGADPAMGAQSIMLADSGSAWQDARAENLLLPVQLADTTGPTLAMDLLGDALAAIWVDPDWLLAAYPAADLDQISSQLNERLIGSVPFTSVETITSEDLASRLSERLPADSVQMVLDRLTKPDRGYLIITLGGT